MLWVWASYGCGQVIHEGLLYSRCRYLRELTDKPMNIAVASLHFCGGGLRI